LLQPDVPNVLLQVVSGDVLGLTFSSCEMFDALTSIYNAGFSISASADPTAKKFKTEHLWQNDSLPCPRLVVQQWSKYSLFFFSCRKYTSCHQIGTHKRQKENYNIVVNEVVMTMQWSLEKFDFEGGDSNFDVACRT
jgi:hypothetical protein